MLKFNFKNQLKFVVKYKLSDTITDRISILLKYFLRDLDGTKCCEITKKPLKINNVVSCVAENFKSGQQTHLKRQFTDFIYHLDHMSFSNFFKPVEKSNNLKNVKRRKSYQNLCIFGH